jgi:hypothetical protein
MLEERKMGSFSTSYINIRCNLSFSTGVRLHRHFRYHLLGQADLEIKVNGDKYLIHNINHREAKRTLELISLQNALTW